MKRKIVFFGITNSSRRRFQVIKWQNSFLALAILPNSNDSRMTNWREKMNAKSAQKQKLQRSASLIFRIITLILSKHLTIGIRRKLFFSSRLSHKCAHPFKLSSTHCWSSFSLSLSLSLSLSISNAQTKNAQTHPHTLYQHQTQFLKHS